MPELRDVTFDPLSVDNIGITLSIELLERPLEPVPPTLFNGAGIYAFYYFGKHPAYRPLVALDDYRGKLPIYIGKAASRTAQHGFNPRVGRQIKLWSRISMHARSINSAPDLSVSDFQCRYLVLHDAFIFLAESAAIQLFRPPWNGMGLGGNAVGGPRMAGRPSLWDALHPGRAGRPSGADRAQEARNLIKRRVLELSTPIEDERIRRMFDRVCKFF